MKSQSLEILCLLYAYKSNKIKQKQNLENVELENLFVFLIFFKKFLIIM